MEETASAAPCAAKRVRSRSSGYVAAVAMAPADAPAMRGMRACWSEFDVVVVEVAWFDELDCGVEEGGEELPGDGTLLARRERLPAQKRYVENCTAE